jgi:3-oxoacyl-[acyl-carrier-protein] synthase II
MKWSSSAMPGRRVVITGMSVITPLGCDVEQVWDAVCEGKSGIREITLFDSSIFKIHFGGQVDDFGVERYLEVREQRRLDRFSQFAIVASEKAVEDSGIDFTKEDPVRCGVIMGSGVGGLKEFEEATKQLFKDPNKLSPHMITRMMANAASGHLSIRHGLQGPISAVATACASSANAIGDAYRTIQQDEADVMVTGGSEAALTPLGLGGFLAMRALSQRTGDPATASRPFDRDREGFVLSEGAGVLVLEEYEHARARGARIYAEVLGYGSTSDGIHIAAPDPEGRGASRAMRRALADAKLDPADIDYVNAHGTGTELGDKAETRAIKSVFNEHAQHVPVSSTKSELGHLLGASGGVELVFTSLAIHRGVMPPTINLDEPDPDCDLDYLPYQAREEKVRFAMSNSFGFGGHNASLVVGSVGAQRRAA